MKKSTALTIITIAIVLFVLAAIKSYHEQNCVSAMLYSFAAGCFVAGGAIILSDE